MHGHLTTIDGFIEVEPNLLATNGSADPELELGAHLTFININVQKSEAEPSTNTHTSYAVL
jgi:hypothetical protein